MPQAVPAAHISRVFISHNNHDKPFVRRLVSDLQNANLRVWLDENELKVGDSIVDGVADALRNTDYVVMVISANSINSAWVRQEINSSLMDELAGKGVAVLPVRIDDSEIPQLLKDRIYADFRADYNFGLERLLSAFRQESEIVGNSVPALPNYGIAPAPTSSCVKSLEKLSEANLRRRIDSRLSSDEVDVVWHGTFSEKIDRAMASQQKPNIIIELIDKAKRRNVMGDLLETLCIDYPHVANP